MMLNAISEAMHCVHDGMRGLCGQLLSVVLSQNSKTNNRRAARCSAVGGVACSFHDFQSSNFGTLDFGQLVCYSFTPVCRCRSPPLVCTVLLHHIVCTLPPHTTQYFHTMCDWPYWCQRHAVFVRQIGVAFLRDLSCSSQDQTRKR